MNKILKISQLKINRTSFRDRIQKYLTPRNNQEL
jgi:hypothetical protein